MRWLAAALILAQLTETIEVRVVNVDVVVTDREGKRITGLTKDDFEILEDRKRQPITNFSEVDVRAGASPSRAAEAGLQTASRRFAFFIDTESIHPSLRKEIFAALHKFVDTHLGPGDLASVVSWKDGLNIVAPLTTDRGVIKAALDSVAQSSTAASARTDFSRVQRACLRSAELMRSGRLPPNLAYAECTGNIRVELASSVNDSRQLMSALNVTLSTLSGAEGKKALVVAGAYLPQQPGQEMFTWANSLFRPYLRGFDAPMDNALDQERPQREAIDKLARSASARGVTMYMIGATTSVDDSVHIQSTVEAPNAGADFLRVGNTAASYESIADATGGMAIIRPLNFDAAFQAIAADLDSYYSLGYRPADGGKRERAIVVRTKNPAWRVRARRSYVPESADDQITDRVIANVYTPAKSDFQVALRAGTPQAKDDKFVVPLEVIFPSKLTLLPQGDQVLGGFTVYIAVGSSQGALSTTFRSPQPVSLTPAGEAEFRKEPILFTAELTVRPGENLISVGVVDQVSREIGFARMTVTAR